MATAPTQDHRPIAVETPLGKDKLLLTGISGTEELSCPFRYELEMLSNNNSVNAADIVGNPATVRIAAGDVDGDYTRYVNGFISEFTHVGWTTELTSYRAVLVPWLWFLDQTADCRIFQDKTTKDIVTKIFQDLGFKDFRWELNSTPPKREYCVQYRETDFNFVSRLLEEEGIFYFFEHSDGSHILVLADSSSSYIAMNDSEVVFPDPNHDYGGLNRVTSWQRTFSFRSGKYSHTDYNFKTPDTKLLKDHAAQHIPFKNASNFEVYDFHGRHEDPGRAKALAKIRMEEIEARHDVGHGESTCASFTAGGKFTFKEHRSDGEVGKSYAITRVHLAARLNNYTGGEAFTSRNSFECIPINVPYRPPRKSRKPVVEGPQTAVIVGPPEERSIEGIHVDEYSRVKAQFHWDREHDGDDKKCCWMRVSQAHAGNGWGYMDIPRVGEEVIVDFIEGDPDRPIITGRVYNGKLMPPYGLGGGDNKTNKTRRGNKTKTYGAGGYNEVTMDDTPGKEQLRMNAQYNMNSNVNYDQTLDVGNNQTEKVAVDRTREVGNNETVTVGVNKSVKVGTNHDETIGTNQNINVGIMKNEIVGVMSNEVVGVAKTTSVGVGYALTVGAAKNEAVGFLSFEEVGLIRKLLVGMNYGITVGTDYEVSVGSNIKITAGSALELVCGSCKIAMDSGGKMTIDAPSELTINGGGATIVMKGGIIDLN